MASKFSHATVLAAGITLTACASSAPTTQEAVMTTAAAGSPSRLAPVKQWPLRFESHSFAIHCYDTYGCKAIYAGHVQRDDDPDELRPSSSTYGDDYRRNWSGAHIMIRNFPAPANVSWRSKNGEAHEAEVDMAAMFKDELVRHDVSREEMADLPHGRYENEPGILLEVNDRTLHVYMRAMIPTKQFQIPGNRYSDFRDDLILVKTYSY